MYDNWFIFYVAVSTHWGKLMRQVSEQCLFALPAAIPDTCFQQKKQWKYFIRASLSLSQFKLSSLRPSHSVQCIHMHTQGRECTHTYCTFPWYLHSQSQCSLCVFNYTPCDRLLLRICRFFSVWSLANGYATDIIGGERKCGIKELYGNKVCQKPSPLFLNTV